MENPQSFRMTSNSTGTALRYHDNSINCPGGSTEQFSWYTVDDSTQSQDIIEFSPRIRASPFVPDLDGGLSDCVSRNSPGSIESDIQIPMMDRFKSLTRRASLRNNQTGYRSPKFYPDIRFTPICTDPGIWQILSSAPGLRGTQFRWDFTLAYHDQLSFTWSLLRMGSFIDRASPVMRPVGILQTTGSGIRAADVLITDLSSVNEARVIASTHYSDSWKLNGEHIGFQLDDDYRYEWCAHEYIPGSGLKDLVLWRIGVHDTTRVLAARIRNQDLIQNPIDHSKGLWCVDVDTDRIKPNVALLSAMSLKIGHPKWHAWFAKKETVFSSPMPFLNFAFQDEGRIHQASGKFWGDWIQPSPGNTDSAKNDNGRISIVRVFNKEYLRRFALCPKLIELLNDEAAVRAAHLCNGYNIHG